MPEWITGHVVGFREALRTIALSSGFTLIPVEVSGPDVAHALAAWLEAEGCAATLLEPRDDEAWARLVADLFAVKRAARGVVLVLGERQPPDGVYAGLRLLNQRRDSLAGHLECPVLWCGPAEFMKLTWERAPDFWSVRALPLKLDAPTTRASEAPLWPGLAVSDPPERLREMMDAALLQGDTRNATRVGDILAETLVLRSELDDAAEVIGEIEQHGPAPESVLLTKGILLARRGDRDAAARLFARVETPELLARRLVCAANLAAADDTTDAREGYEQALTVARVSGDRMTEGVALANVGILAMDTGAADVAVERLEEALAIFREIDDTRNEARVATKLGSAHLLRRDSRQACELLEAALVGFRDVGDRRGEAETLRRLAYAYLQMADPDKAKDDAERARAIANELGDAAAARAAEAILARLD